MVAKVASLIVFCAIVAGCATQDEQVAEKERYSAPVYRTGSNLPAGRESNQQPTEMSESEKRNLEAWRDQARPPRKPPG